MAVYEWRDGQPPGDDELATGIAVLRRHAEELETRAAQRSEVSVPELQEAIEDLYIGLEELEVASEQQRQTEGQMKLVQERLEREQTRYADLFKNAPEGYVVTNRAGLIEEANFAAARMFEANDVDLVGAPLGRFVAYEELSDYRSLLRSLQNGKVQTHQLLRFSTNDGARFLISVTAQSTDAEEGRPEGIRWLMRDVSAQTALDEERLQHSQETVARTEAEAARHHIAETLERMTDAFVALDHDFRVTYLNSAAEAIFSKLVPSLDHAVLHSPLEDILGKEFLGQCRQVWESGQAGPVRMDHPVSDVWLEGQAYPGTTGLSLYLSDVALSKQAAKLLRELSTPVVAIAERVLLLPLIGEVDGERATEVAGKLTHAVEQGRALCVVIDTSGAVFTDDQGANVLVQAASMIRLLGAETVLTGLSPQACLALAHLQVPLRDMVTAGDLRSGIEYAMHLTEPRAAGR